MDYATLFLDLAKFYDSIGFVLLMQASKRLGYPASDTLLEVKIYASPRMIKQCRLVSTALDPGKSVVAGSPRRVDMAKVILHGLLDAAHVASPRAGL